MDLDVEMRFEPRGMGFERAASLEWLLANGLGGYASSTLIGLNTRKYHGLLVASLGNLQRFVFLQELRDSVGADGFKAELHCSELAGRLEVPGLDCLAGFSKSANGVVFFYSTPYFTLSKSVSVPSGRNSVAVSYELSNKSGLPLRHVVQPVVNCRRIHETRRGGFPYGIEVSGGSAVLSLGCNELHFDASDGTLGSQDVWTGDLYYRREAKRGYDAIENSLMPLSFSFDVPAESSRAYHLSACIGRTAAELRAPAGGRNDGGLVGLLRDAANSFIVSTEAGSTVIAGYHWFGEWGRDAMVSLPGLTLVNGRIDDARVVLERFLGSMSGGRVMTECESGSPSYRDYDSTLWMIDRLLQYVKYVGPDRGKKLLGEHWSRITEAMEYYASIEHDGLIKHKSGTWMDTLERSDAVEIQALWYNALLAYGKLAEISGHQAGLPVGDLARRFEESFMETYWNGRYLRDCIGDDSLRPNQLIALSLDYTCVDRDDALKILESVEESLLTHYGLRTLDPRDGRYRGSYTGGVREREESYHNGTVWPWLLGPYVKACVKYHGIQERNRLRALLEDFFSRTLAVYTVGSIGEAFDGDHPHRPRGCVAQAWSVGEPLRAYLEDALGTAPTQRV